MKIQYDYDRMIINYIGMQGHSMAHILEGCIYNYEETGFTFNFEYFYFNDEDEFIQALFLLELSGAELQKCEIFRSFYATNT